MLGEHHRLAAQRMAQCLLGEVRTDRPVTGIQEHTEQRLVAVERVTVDLHEFVVPVRHHRISPVDDPAEATVLHEHVLSGQVAVDEDVVEPSEPGEVARDVRDQMWWQRACGS